MEVFIHHSSSRVYKAAMKTANHWGMLLLLLAGMGACVAWASPVAMGGEDHEQARQAVQRGQVMPLHDILAEVEHGYRGQVLNIEFERETGHEGVHESGRAPAGERFVYKIRLLQMDGRIVKLKVDAANGQVLGVKRKER